MLKLEKDKRSPHIAISLRTREGRFNRTFMLALGIACGLHLAAICLFTIHKYMRANETILSPSLVETDVSDHAPNADVLAQVDNEVHASLWLAKPKQSFPAFPEPTRTTMIQPIEYHQDVHLLLHPIDPLEEMERSLMRIGFTEESAQVLMVHIAGELAEVEWLNQALIDQRADAVKKLMKEREPVRLAYHVQVDSRTGRVFWWNKQEGGAGMEVGIFGEHLLKELRFAPHEKMFVWSGEVEIMLQG